MARCPKTAEEAWKRLDKRLTQEEKQQIVSSHDMSEFHFGLGMWIRNHWIYTGEQENNDGGSAGTQEQPKPTPTAPKPKSNEGKGTGNVTFYTRVGMPFDPKTGKERPCKKHVVTRSWWLVNKSRLARLGYNLIKVEGE